MSGWHILVWLSVCATGILIFIVPVADEIELTTAHMRLLHEAQAKARLRRQQADSGAVAKVVGEKTA